MAIEFQGRGVGSDFCSEPVCVVLDQLFVQMPTTMKFKENDAEEVSSETDIGYFVRRNT